MRKHSRVEPTFGWATAYSFGTLGMVFERGWEATGKLQVIHRERIPITEKPLVVVSNHPGMVEAVVLPFIFAGPLPLRPGLVPLSTPDKSNFHDKWYWGWARSLFIEIDRGDPASEMAAFRRIHTVLESGRRVILFLEGGRTTSVADGHVYSLSGKHKVRPFKESLGLIVQRLEECTVIPVWVEGSEDVLPRGTWVPRFSQPLRITIGEPKVYRQDGQKLTGAQRRTKACQMTQEWQSDVLALADECAFP